MSATPSPGPIVVRPTAAARRRALLTSLIAVPLVVLGLLLNPRLPVPLIVFLILLIAAAGVVTARRMRRLRVEYGDGRFRFVSMYRTRVFGVGDIRQVHTFTTLRQGMYTFADLMVEGRDGRRLMRLPGLLWDVAVLGDLAREFQARDIPLVVTQIPVTAAQVRERFPRLVTWFEANQLLTAVLAGVGVLVLAVIATVVVLFAASLGRVT